MRRTQRNLSGMSTYVYVDVSAAKDDLVVVDQPDVLVDHVVEVIQAATCLVDEEANGLQRNSAGEQSAVRKGAKKQAETCSASAMSSVPPWAQQTPSRRDAQLPKVPQTAKSTGGQAAAQCLT